MHTDHYFSHTDWGRYLSMKLDSNDSVHMAFSINKIQILVASRMYTDNYYPTFDSDGDGIPDYEDSFPSNPSETTDYDGDGSGDNADNDDDNDGIIDLLDDCQFGIIGPGADYDSDGCKDSEDGDDDNDGFADEIDNCPQGMTDIGNDLTWMDVKMQKIQISMAMASQMKMMISIMTRQKTRTPMGTESVTIPTNCLMMRMRPRRQ